jgi:hypothetical protein
VTTIAAAALIAGAGLATAQQTQPTPNAYQDQTPGMANPSKAEPGTIKKSSAREGKSASVMKKHHYGKHTAMKGTAQGRSAATVKKHHYGKHTAMKGTAQGRSVMPKKIDSGSAKSPSQGAY